MLLGNLTVIMKAKQTLDVKISIVTGHFKLVLFSQSIKITFVD